MRMMKLGHSIDDQSSAFLNEVGAFYGSEVAPYAVQSDETDRRGGSL
jgi:hypothetical protein